MKAKAGKTKCKGYILVRDKRGRPKFDDWFNIPEGFYASLTDEDWEYIADKRDELKQEG